MKEKLLLCDPPGQFVEQEIGEPSGTPGIPLPSEKRAVTGIELPLNSVAPLSLAASAEAFEGALHDNAFRMKGAKARMHTVDLVRQIDDLCRDRWVVCNGRGGNQQ
ncbi:MAG TPA: hypothetical protein VGN03_11345, partial [Steroidobacteraceae bacterium]